MLCLTLCLAMMLATPPEALPFSRSQPTRECWEKKIEAIPAGLSDEDFEFKVLEARGTVPHLSFERFSFQPVTRNGDEQGLLIPLDDKWAVLRTRPGAPHGELEPPAHVAGDRASIVGLFLLTPQIPPDLYNAVAAISACAKPGYSADPVNLIRAVNTLQSLGEEKALRAIAVYLKLAETNRFDSGDLDPERVIWVARLLYETPLIAGRVAPPRLGAPGPEWNLADSIPTYPIIMESDTPFFLIDGYMLGGRAETPEHFLERCREKGTFRSAPLEPSGDPIGTADRLLALQNWPDEIRNIIRRQALNAASGALGVRGEDNCNQIDWRQVQTEASNRALVWSAQGQDFVATK
ncbi:MAG: hypothetical protein ACREJD_14900 [Phycisphaerales bacterium]